jgi:hypothetical protein
MVCDIASENVEGCSFAVYDDLDSNRAVSCFAGVHMPRGASQVVIFPTHLIPGDWSCGCIEMSMMWIWRCIDSPHLHLQWQKHHKLEPEQRHSHSVHNHLGLYLLSWPSVDCLLYSRPTSRMSLATQTTKLCFCILCMLTGLATHSHMYCLEVFNTLDTLPHLLHRSSPIIQVAHSQFTTSLIARCYSQ